MLALVRHVAHSRVQRHRCLFEVLRDCLNVSLCFFCGADCDPVLFDEMVELEDLVEDQAERALQPFLLAEIRFALAILDCSPQEAA